MENFAFYKTDKPLSKDYTKTKNSHNLLKNYNFKTYIRYFLFLRNLRSPGNLITVT